MSPEDEAELLREYEQWRQDRKGYEPNLTVEAFLLDRQVDRTVRAADDAVAYLREVAFTDVSKRPSASEIAEHIVVDLFGESLS